jgi:hypothetical protein
MKISIWSQESCMCYRQTAQHFKLLENKQDWHGLFKCVSTGFVCLFVCSRARACMCTHKVSWGVTLHKEKERITWMNWFEIYAISKQSSPLHSQFSMPQPVSHTFEKLSQFLSRQHAEVIYNYHNRNVPVTGHGEGQHRRYEELKVGDSQACKLPND